MPGLKILAPATVADARFMLAPALEDPDPVLIFEHAGLYNLSETIDLEAPRPGLYQAVVRRAGDDLTLVTYGGSLGKTLEAAATLAAEGIDAEVIDLRALRPLDAPTFLASVARTHRAVIVDEGWRSGSLAAEIACRIQEEAFWSLDAPVARVCSEEVPMPYARHLEQAALPRPEAIVAAARRTLERVP